jgi:L-rhamnose isomerase/sugar isomerase
MIDQCFNIESKIEGMIISVINCQTAYARALIVNYDALREKQLNGDVMGAHRELMDALETDVRPLLAQVRLEMGRPSDPIAAFRADDYEKRIVQERGVITGGGAGFPG